MEKPKPEKVLSEADPPPPSECMRKRHQGSRLGKSTGWIPAPVHPSARRPVQSTACTAVTGWPYLKAPQQRGVTVTRTWPSSHCYCICPLRQHLKSAIKIRKQRTPAQITAAATLRTPPGSKEARDWDKKRLKDCFDFAIPECVQVAEKNKTFSPM